MAHHHQQGTEYPIVQDPVEYENLRQDKNTYLTFIQGKKSSKKKRLHAFDNNNISSALKHGSQMCQELTTSKLYPERYYELYLAATMELSSLEERFDDPQKRGMTLPELYDTVQHCGNVIPRMYLLFTVGSSLIRNDRTQSKAILSDLVKLARGVQHPLRGLFLRDYLSRISKDKLPVSEGEKEGIEFLLENFGEMNKLWVRMQHQGAQRDKTKRESERQRVQMLIGKSLESVSKLSMDIQTYADFVLPKIIELTVNCKDTLAQEYLMEDDSFHLATLSTLLGAINQLQPDVREHHILRVLMNRLANFARDSPESFPAQLQIFPMFHERCQQVLVNHPNIDLRDIVALQAALANVSSKCYPDRLDYIDMVLGFTADVMKSKSSAKPDSKVVSQVASLLRAPLETLGIKILELEKYPVLFEWFDFDTRKSIACDIIRSVLNKKHYLDTADKVEKLFSLISPLLKDIEDTVPITEDNQFEFDQEQFLVSKLIHNIYHEDVLVRFSLFVTARKHFGQGGILRFQHTLVPLVFNTLEMSRKAFSLGGDAAAKVKKMMQFVHEIITALTPHFPEISLRLFLHAAQCADLCYFENIAYEFVTQAFIIYEDEITDSKCQVVDNTLIVGTLQTLKCFGEENYDTLATKCTQHSAKLLRKPDQTRAVYQCSHLFFNPEFSVKFNPKLVLQCLVRALKIANVIMNVDQKVALFVEIFNKYLYYRSKQCETILEDNVNDLKALIEENIGSIDTTVPENAAVIAQYKNTLEHIVKMQSATNVGAGKNSMVGNPDTSDITDD